MKFPLTYALLALAMPAAVAQQPPGVPEMLQTLVSQQATHTAFTFDREMLQTADGLMGIENNALNSITVENYHYPQPAFYVPENMAALKAAYGAAGYKHLVEQHVDARDAAMPHGTLTDLWLHNNGTQIDSVIVLLRTPRQMSVIDVTGSLRPLDLVHLSGHFGIPKVDPGAVMVPAPPGK
jgi:hypothetical protein